MVKLQSRLIRWLVAGLLLAPYSCASTAPQFPISDETRTALKSVKAIALEPPRVSTFDHWTHKETDDDARIAADLAVLVTQELSRRGMIVNRAPSGFDPEINYDYRCVPSAQGIDAIAYVTLSGPTRSAGDLAEDFAVSFATSILTVGLVGGFPPSNDPVFLAVRLEHSPCSDKHGPVSAPIWFGTYRQSNSSFPDTQHFSKEDLQSRLTKVFETFPN